MSKKTLIVLTILTLLIAFMDISCLPCILIKCTVADVDPFIIPILFNFVIIGILAITVIKLCRIDYPFGFTQKGLKEGLKKYALPGVFAGICSLVAFCIGLFPFDYKPTVWKIVIEGIVYYIGVGIIEEFYVRGLFLNIVESVCHKSSKKTELAIVISSVVFGFGHVPGVIGMGFGVIAFKVVSTIGMGLYFGTIYKKSGNLWVPMILHAIIDICALPYCFTSNMVYADSSIVILVITYLALGCYSLWVMSKNSIVTKK